MKNWPKWFVKGCATKSALTSEISPAAEGGVIFTLREGQGCACPWASAPSVVHARIAETANSLDRTIPKSSPAGGGHLKPLPHDTGWRYRAAISRGQQVRSLHRSRD